MKVEKRDGRIVPFDKSKIHRAIEKAFESCDQDTGGVAGVVDIVMEEVTSQGKETWHIEELQDIVEDSLMTAGYTDVARSYIKYRQHRHQLRQLRDLLGVTDDLKLGINAATLLNRRYLLKDGEGNVTETPSQLFRRVAKAVAKVERHYDRRSNGTEVEDLFYHMMVNLEFLPNSPTLFSAGTELGQLSACFVIPIEDSLDSIFQAVWQMAKVQKSGGGTGFSFSRLRPKDAPVGTTGGVASGPVSFMRIFDTATDVIKQGGCLSVETLVQTNMGLRRLGALVNCKLGDEGPLREVVQTRDDFQQAFLAANNGLTEVYRIKTHLGYSLDATYNHKIRVVTENGIEWKAVKDLVKGDWLVIKRGGYHGIDSSLPPCPDQHHNAAPISLPKTMTPALGELVGYFIGDGCLSPLNRERERLVFSVPHNTPDVTEWIERYLKGLGLNPRREQKGEEAAWSIVVRSVTLGEWWHKAGLDKRGSLEAEIPQIIMSSSKETVCAFFRGLFEADGSVHTDGYPQLSSISEKLIMQTQQLLLALGIVSNKHKITDRSGAYGSNPVYVLTVTHRPSVLVFSELIGFKSERKRMRLSSRIKKVIGALSDPIPYAGSLISRYYTPPGRGSGKNRGPRSSNPTIGRELTRYIRGERHPHRQRLLSLAEKMEELKPILSDEVMRDDFVYVRITDVEHKEAFTGEIEVVGSEYVANGFLVHNKRRGANMGVLRIDHPDILEFIRCKADKVSYRNFNISVAVTDKFMEAYFADKEYELIDPHTRKATEKISARFVFEQIAHYAWLTGDPGILFIDRINQAHPLKGEEIEATNPCGEVPLLGHECCVLGSINLAKFVKDGKVDYKHLGEIVALGVRFLDNVVDANKYPFNEISIKAKAGRKIGLGIMGFAEMLIQLGVPYASKEGLQWARDIMSFINERARKASAKLAKLRGNFELKGSSKIRAKYRRNATVNTIAPTGSIGIIAGTSSGIEPLFGISYVRVLAEGVQLHETNKYFEQMAKAKGFWDDTLAKEIAKTGSVQHIDTIPAKVKALFKTAHEISPKQHVRMQAAFQEHVDNAVSKTCNLPNSATPEDIRRIYLLAWESGCKGITVFRDGCLDEQVLYKGDTLTCELDDPSCPSCSG